MVPHLIILERTLVKAQSSRPDVFIKPPFLIKWFMCEWSCGGQEKTKTAELENIEQ